MPAESLRFDLVEHVLLIVHADMPPSASDWERLMLVRNANRTRIRGTLVVAPPRATINSEQRSDVSTFLKQNGGRIAVLTNSALVRGAALALTLLGAPVRAFAPSGLGPALAYLELPSRFTVDLGRRIETLQTQLGTRPPETHPRA